MHSCHLNKYSLHTLHSYMLKLTILAIRSNVFCLFCMCIVYSKEQFHTVNAKSMYTPKFCTAVWNWWVQTQFRDMGMFVLSWATFHPSVKFILTALMLSTFMEKIIVIAEQTYVYYIHIVYESVPCWYNTHYCYAGSNGGFTSPRVSLSYC